MKTRLDETNKMRKLMGLSLLEENDSRDRIEVGRVYFKNVQPDSNNILKFNSDNLVGTQTKDYIQEVGMGAGADYEIEIEVLPDDLTSNPEMQIHPTFRYVPNSIKINKFIEENSIGKYDFINPEKNPSEKEAETFYKNKDKDITEERLQNLMNQINPEWRVNELKSAFEEKLNPIKL